MLVDSEVHSHIAGHLPAARYLQAVKVNDDHIVCPKQVFARCTWRREQELLTQPDREIAGRAWHEAEPMEPLPKFDEVSP
jgi:hypothetical protein